jgi:hypothetical protein
MSKLAKSLVLAAAAAAIAAPVSAAEAYRHAPRDVMRPGEAMRPSPWVTVGSRLTDVYRHGPRGDVFVRRAHGSATWN